MNFDIENVFICCYLGSGHLNEWSSGHLKKSDMVVQ